VEEAEIAVGHPTNGQIEFLGLTLNQESIKVIGIKKG
jgi:hypothetical protein